MKKIFLPLLTLIIVSSLFFACSVPWDMGGDLDKLKEDVVFMGMPDSSTNGHDKATLNFVDSTFVSENYTFDYSTAAAETSGKYTDKSWYLSGGMKGSFTYDNETRLLNITVTEVYILKSDASTQYAADYEWHTIVAADETAVWAGDVPKTVGMTTLLTQDGMIPTYAGTTDGSWVLSQNMTFVSGATLSMKETLSMTGTTFTRTTSSDSAEKDAAASAIGHVVRTYNYNVNNFFLTGEETGDKEFDKVWTKGNSVTFLIERTKYTRLDYAGTTVPTIPTADSVTGTAFTGTSGVDYAYISLEAGNTSTYALTHMDDCIVYSEYLTYALRGLE